MQGEEGVAHLWPAHHHWIEQHTTNRLAGTESEKGTVGVEFKQLATGTNPENGVVERAKTHY